MDSLNLASLPQSLTWINTPENVSLTTDNSLTITAGAGTDRFFDPAGTVHQNNAPVALFAPPEAAFVLSARVTVAFKAMFDAGALMVYADDNHWAKLCFEYSPTHDPMIVSVVTRHTSDDSNAVIIPNISVYLRVYRQGDTLAFHYSADGNYWHLVRYFTIGPLAQMQVGFCAQSPTGTGCQAHFSDIAYAPGALSDLRNGT